MITRDPFSSGFGLAQLQHSEEEAVWFRVVNSSCRRTGWNTTAGTAKNSKMKPCIEISCGMAYKPTRTQGAEEKNSKSQTMKRKQTSADSSLSPEHEARSTFASHPLTSDENWKFFHFEILKLHNIVEPENWVEMWKSLLVNMALQNSDDLSVLILIIFNVKSELFFRQLMSVR